MKESFLRVISTLGETGYYARTRNELEILQGLIDENLIARRRGTKKVFIITERGSSFLSGRKIDTNQFFEAVRNAYSKLTNELNPIARIGDIREIVVIGERISDAFFDSQLLQLHENGTISLQTATIPGKRPNGGVSDYHYLNIDL